MATRQRSRRDEGGRDRLDRYRRMRDFTVTAEPAGVAVPGPPPSGSARFVVQRHRASRLHYDFRLEVDGVLASWAVPKGPTLDPSVRRMAVHVEDHPLEYFDFEGVIPRDQYGGGDVIVWDWGTWSTSDGADPVEAIRAGDLHIDLRGEKLSGRFALVRRGGRQAGGKDQWLLIHKDDAAAVTGWDPEDHLRSVKSGRTNDDVAEAPASTWSSAEVWASPTADELDALASLGASGTWRFGGRELKLTNLDKVLFPHRGNRPRLTKRDLIRHYATVAPAMLPYLRARPVNLHRYPDGIDRPGFWHKEAPDFAPEWITRWRNHDADPGETELYLVLDSPPALAWVANYGAVELHPWTSTADHPQQPSWAMIDIDPGDRATFDDALVLARLYRTALDHLGVRGMPKVTGQRGIQIWVPVAAGYSFDQTRAFVETISRAIGRTVPDMVSWEWKKDRRGGLTRLDYTQNAINKTLVAPFSVRPAHGAPVSVPITWDELDDPDLRPDRWNIRNVGERLAEAGDPLAPLVGLDQRLP